MFNRNKLSLIALLMLISGTSAFPQKKEMEIADSQFNALQYNAAAGFYQEALAKFKEQDVVLQQDATFKLAECYRLMNDPDQAEPLYGMLATSSYADRNPAVYVQYASILETKGNVATARDYYTKCLKADPGDLQAKKGIRSCDWFIANQGKKAQVNVLNVMSLNTAVDDFSPVFYSNNSDQLVITSNRPGCTGKNYDMWTGSKFSDLFISTLRGSGWSNPVLFDETGLINTDIHDGAPAYNRNYSIMYFTRCDMMGKNREYCKIFRTEKNGDTWLEPQPVLTDSTANVGQPTLSRDELTIIFSSNKGGGCGGKDLWMARRVSKNEAFGQPVTLGAGINSSGDEMFPYLYDDTTLYFSSNGFEGYGGLDIYKSILKNNAWGHPVNLLAPINSGYDDFGILVTVPGEEGYFSSNRPGGKGGDDIYKFIKKTLFFNVTGTVRDNLTMLQMEGAQVLLIKDKKDTINTLTDGKGFYQFDTSMVLEDHDYELIYKNDNYFSKKELFSTIPFEDNHDFIIDILLEPIPEKPIVLPDILYALDKWDLQPQYQDSLLNLVDLLLVNENLVIELRSHTDTRASFEYNDALSQKRAQSVVDFLVSREVDPGRLVAKGYGERIPRVLDRDMVRENYLFMAGTELNDRFINNLPSDVIKEAAFQLNRRTEFSVLSKDYKR
jgi:peptidoglycan-associated lipoprotein